MLSKNSLPSFQRLCDKVASQIQKIMDAPFVARLKGMIIRRPDETPKPFDINMARAWLVAAAPRELPPHVSMVPSTRRMSMFECDLFARLSEWNAMRKPSQATTSRWDSWHAEARGERLIPASGLTR